MHISNFIRTLKIQNILDIGAGTGRGLQCIKEHHLKSAPTASSRLRIRGKEPLTRALRRNPSSKGKVVGVAAIGIKRRRCRPKRGGAPG